MRTVGVEEELLVVGLSDRRPAAVGDSVVEGVDEEHGAQFEPEFKKEQAELGSEPTESIDHLGEQLRVLRNRMMESARRSGAEVVAIATSPFRVRPTPSAGERYARMTEAFGLLAREQLTCGQHVHVSVESPEEGVGVLDRIRPWLHVLVALSTNSPFWHGEDSGYASYRTLMWGLWPTAGPTEAFGSVEGYERSIEEMLQSGAAMDRGMLYYDARLSARYPTIEIRVADVCTEVRDSQLLAALARALVQVAADELKAGQEAPAVSVGLLRAAAWRAARSGLTGQLVDTLNANARPAWDVIQRLLDRVGEQLADNGDADFVAEQLDRLKESGTGADWQRRSFARRGSLEDVVDEAAQRTVGLELT